MNTVHWNIRAPFFWYISIFNINENYNDNNKTVI